MAAILNIIKLSLLFLINLPVFIFNKEKAVYNFLKSAGATFIKLGQLLSTRPDLVGESMAEKLSSFQDKVPAFDEKKVKQIIKQRSSSDFATDIVNINYKATASASIAQVHKATLKSGEDVAIKILRPNIRRTMNRDIKTLQILVFFIKIFSKFYGKAFGDILRLLITTSKTELDLSLEAAAASELKDNLNSIEGFYVPKIYWKYTNSNILVLEWIDGIPFSNMQKIRSSKADLKKVAKNLVISYLTQVYKYGHFHADMHPGNLFLLKNGDIGVVDFGITSSIDSKTRIAVAEILINFLKKDYRKVAKIHLDAKMVPEDTDIDQLALHSRKVGESIIGSKVKDISLATLLENLITMTRAYNLKTDPQLLLLQKTILLVEGVAMSLDEDINIWEIASPWMKDWARTNIGFDAKIRDFLIDLEKSVKNLLLKNI